MVSQRRRPWRLAAPLILIGGAWSAYNAPFTVTAFPPDNSDAGTAPYQALIDYVDRRGGMTIWSYPEAKDFQVHTYPLTRQFVAKFTTKTDPYPEVLLTTNRFTAFGATYQDTTTAERPGQIWDRALEQYCLGRRSRPPEAARFPRCGARPVPTGGPLERQKRRSPRRARRRCVDRMVPPPRPRSARCAESADSPAAGSLSPPFPPRAMYPS